MAVLSYDDFDKLIRSKYEGDTSDEAIKALEDIADTMADIRSISNEDWKRKYEENDKQWRDKYTARFFGDVAEEINQEGNPVDEATVLDGEQEKDVPQEESYDSVEDLLKD